jgi:hypothetical protein
MFKPQGFELLMVSVGTREYLDLSVWNDYLRGIQHEVWHVVSSIGESGCGAKRAH